MSAMEPASASAAKVFFMSVPPETFKFLIPDLGELSPPHETVCRTTDRYPKKDVTIFNQLSPSSIKSVYIVLTPPSTSRVTSGVVGRKLHIFYRLDTWRDKQVGF